MKKGSAPVAYYKGVTGNSEIHQREPATNIVDTARKLNAW